ncbi:MAG: nitronate monooxygenase [Pseudobdellovibrionaceae bacterium]
MTEKFPTIIQGGMGIGVSNWVLAKAVAMQGEMGVVSGTCMNSVLIRRLQDGDEGGHCRRAMAAFPVPEVAESVLNKYFLPEGRQGKPYKRSPMFAQVYNKELAHTTVLSNFVEVYLAKEGHNGLVGINLLEKIVLPNLPSIYGAMLAGVDYVLMGAGIPREIPGALDKFSKHQAASLKLPVEGALPDDDYRLHFDPKEFFDVSSWSDLKRPLFLPIVSSAVLALNLSKKATGRVDGFIIEHWTAGGHNAPPRGQMQLDADGQPIYGERDEVDFAKFKEMGLPFWLAGSCGTPERLQESIALGAQGVQVGTAFAFCDESGLSDSSKNSVRQAVYEGKSFQVYTDPLASPSGFPFKVVMKEDTLWKDEVYQARPRKCDLGYLRTAYRQENGTAGFRCAAEPIAAYLKKGGTMEETQGRKCLCNGLFAGVGMGQNQESGYDEAEIMTAGDDIVNLKRFLKNGPSFSAADVIHDLRSGFSSSFSTSKFKAEAKANSVFF